MTDVAKKNNDLEYTYAVGRIRAKELKLLHKADIEALLSAKTAEAAIMLLGDKGWDIDNISPSNFETMLSKQTEKTWELINEIAPDKHSFDFLLYKNDFHNLKAALKSVFMNSTQEGIYLSPSVYSAQDIYAAIIEKRFDRLPQIMQEAGERAFNVLMQTGDGQLCDIIIDKAALEAINQFGKQSQDSFVAGLADIMVAGADIKTAVRAARTGKNLSFLDNAIAECSLLNISELKRAAVAGMEEIKEYLSHTQFSQAVELIEQSMSDFEKWCDNATIRYAQSAKLTAFGIAPLIAYILARDTEIQSVRIIVSGKHNALDDNDIRERLRDLYV